MANSADIPKNNQPAAVILSPSEFARLSEIEEDYMPLLEATERLRHSPDSVSLAADMKELGISEDDLASTEDVVIE